MKKGQQIANIHGCWQQISISTVTKERGRTSQPIFWKRWPMEKCFLATCDIMLLRTLPTKCWLWPKKNCFVSWFWHRIPLLFYIFLRPLSSLNKSLVCHCTARQLTLVLFIYLPRYPSIFVANKTFCAAVSLVQNKI